MNCWRCSADGVGACRIISVLSVDSHKPQTDPPFRDSDTSTSIRRCRRFSTIDISRSNERRLGRLSARKPSAAHRAGEYLAEAVPSIGTPSCGRRRLPPGRLLIQRPRLPRTIKSRLSSIERPCSGHVQSRSKLSAPRHAVSGDSSLGQHLAAKNLTPLASKAFTVSADSRQVMS
jgi:hypothetical protein